MMTDFNKIQPLELFNPKVKDSFFSYTSNEVKYFTQSFDIKRNTDLLNNLFC